jgi:predicted amidophosphoribosyltransferase
MGLNKKKRVLEWCPGGGKELPEPKRRARCSVCGKQFAVRKVECHDPGCFHYDIPKHKRRV